MIDGCIHLVEFHDLDEIVAHSQLSSVFFSYLLSPTNIEVRVIAITSLSDTHPSFCSQLSCRVESVDLGLSQHQLRDLSSLLRCLFEMSEEHRQRQNQFHDQSLSVSSDPDSPFKLLIETLDSTFPNFRFGAPTLKLAVIRIEISTLKIQLKRPSKLCTPGLQSNTDSSVFLIRSDDLIGFLRLRQYGASLAPVLVEGVDVHMRRWIVADAAAGLLIFCLPTPIHSSCPLPWSSDYVNIDDLTSESFSIPSPIPQSSRSSSMSSLVSAMKDVEEESFLEFEKNVASSVDEPFIEIESAVDDGNLHRSSADGIEVQLITDNTERLTIKWNTKDVSLMGDRPPDEELGVSLSLISSNTESYDEILNESSNSSDVKFAIRPIQLLCRSIRHLHQEINFVYQTFTTGELSNCHFLLECITQMSKSGALQTPRPPEQKIMIWPLNSLSISSSGGYICIIDESIQRRIVDELQEGDLDSTVKLAEYKDELPPHKDLFPFHKDVVFSDSNTSLPEGYLDSYRASGICLSFGSLSVSLDPQTPLDFIRHLGLHIANVSLSVLSNTGIPLPLCWNRCVAPFSFDAMVSACASTEMSGDRTKFGKNLGSTMNRPNEPNEPTKTDTGEYDSLRKVKMSGSRRGDCSDGELLVRIGVSALSVCFNRELFDVAQNLTTLLYDHSFSRLKSSDTESSPSKISISDLPNSYLSFMGLIPKRLRLLDFTEVAQSSHNRLMDSSAVFPNTEDEIPSHVPLPSSTPSYIESDPNEDDDDGMMITTESEEEDVFYDSVDVRDAIVADLTCASLCLYFKDKELNLKKIQRESETEKLWMKPTMTYESVWPMIHDNLRKLFPYFLIGSSPSSVHLFSEFTIWQLLFIAAPNAIPSAETTLLNYGLGVDVKGLSVSSILTDASEESVDSFFKRDWVGLNYRGVEDLGDLENMENRLFMKLGCRIDTVAVDALKTDDGQPPQPHSPDRVVVEDYDEMYATEREPDKLVCHLVDRWVQGAGRWTNKFTPPKYSINHSIARTSLLIASQPKSKKPPFPFWDSPDLRLLSGEND